MSRARAAPAALAVSRVHEGAVAPAATDDHGDAGRDHGTGGAHLRGHAAGAKGTAGATRHGNDVGVHALDALDEMGRGVAVGVCRVQAIDVREDDIEVGVDERGHDGAQHVIVAKGELAHAHRVVLVHDGHHAKVEQALEGVARVEVARAVNDVAPREQDLPAGGAILGQHLGIALDKGGLASGGAGLKRGDVTRALGEPEQRPAHRGGAARDEDDPVPTSSELANLRAKRTDEGHVELAGLIHERRRANLGNDETTHPTPRRPRQTNPRHRGPLPPHRRRPPRTLRARGRCRRPGRCLPQ